MNEILEVKEIKELGDDYNKCDYYLNELNNGNINFLKEAIDFSNKKYKEFSIKDTDIAVINSNLIPTNLDDITQTKVNLKALQKMIIEIISKKTYERSDK